uniref:Beta-1,4-galactosyltransferase n=1 Tax=Schistosoma japonicum TaxID=6182 RepID=Q5DI62_SCHJA|nr:SJCHGC09338 protein [Schistosoma japonicum]
MLHFRKCQKRTYVLIALCFLAVFLYFNKRCINNDVITSISDWKWGPLNSHTCSGFVNSKEDPIVNRMAVLVPFRDRFTELQEFIPHLESFLNNQNVRHTFFIINQVDSLRFNRGALLNVGAIESLEAEVNGIVVENIFEQHKLSSQWLKLPFTNYLALHDVDLLPVDPAFKISHPTRIGTNSSYSIFSSPRYHFFKKYAGGVLIIRRTHSSLVGGMSNSFWGWGREDDEFQIRLKLKGFQILTPTNVTMGLKAFRHIHQEDQHKRDDKTYYNPDVIKLIRIPIGGLTSLNYTVVNRRLITISRIPVVVINVKLYCDSINCKSKS